MNCCRKVKAFILQADLFYSSEILRYNDETQYKTLSGAILSLIIMGSIIAGFSSMINFVVFITYYLYKLLKLCGKDQGFETSKKMEKYQEEIVKQLDIKVILQRIIKLQLCMSHLFDNEEIQGIKISEEVTYERARYLRALLHPNDHSQSQENASRKKIEQEDKDKEKEIQKEKQKDKDNILQSQLSGMGILPMFPPIADTPVELSVDRQSEIQDSKRSSFLNNIKALRMNARTSDVKMKILLDIRKDMKLAMSTFFEQEQIPSAILIQRKIQRR